MSNPHKPWLDKAKQNKKFCGTNCKGPNEKTSEQKSTSNVTALNKEKPSCIKPWLEKAAEKKGRRGSSLSTSTPSKTSSPMTMSMMNAGRPSTPSANRLRVPSAQSRLSDRTVQNPKPLVYTIAEFKKQAENLKRFSIPEFKTKPNKSSWGSLNKHGSKTLPKTNKKNVSKTNISSKSFLKESSPIASRSASPTLSPQIKTSALKAPVQLKSSETKPSETKPTETKPSETKPSETKPSETKPSEYKPSEYKPSEYKPIETKPIEIKPEENSAEYKLSSPNMPETLERSEMTELEKKEETKPKPIQTQSTEEDKPQPIIVESPKFVPSCSQPPQPVASCPLPTIEVFSDSHCEPPPPTSSLPPPLPTASPSPTSSPPPAAVYGDSENKPSHQSKMEFICKKNKDCSNLRQGDQQDKTYFVGVDVGTGSVRAALVTKDGQIVKTSVCDIKTWNIQPNFYEQSSDNIWGAVCLSVKNIVSQINPSMVRGIGFDATCSMVCLDQNGQPLSVSPSGNDEQNVILWLDHRAVVEAQEINTTKHPVLQFIGGHISPEHEIPKLRWLKKNLIKNCWERAGYFFDLPDFLTWRATDDDSRSVCSLVCKWTFDMKIDGSKVKGTEGWNKSFFEQVGLLDLSQNDWKKIGSKILVPGCSAGNGLSIRTAKEFGLNPGTPVGTSIIDCYAGGLGLIGCNVEGIDPDFQTRLSLICGTSTCHIALSDTPVVTPGMFGPYKHAMIPGMWLNEGGQSVTGKLVNHMIETHPATPEILKQIGKRPIQDYLNELICKMSDRGQDIALLSSDFHVWPDFHGNRSPITDPTLKGMVCGLTLEKSAKNLALIYLATLQALSYGTRYIIERLRHSGHHELKTILIWGGLGKNKLFLKSLADACNMPVIIPHESECVLLGASILGASASGIFPDLSTTLQNMAGTGSVTLPNSEITKYHEKKYRVFIKMYEDQVSYRNIMN